MRKRLSLFAALAALLVLSAMAARAQDAPAPAHLSKITDSVYAYVDVPAGTPGNAMCANVGVVIGRDAVLVVDTLTSAKEAGLLVENIKQITDKPIRYVVNTHYHLDHTLGNCVFKDLGAVIISQARTREAALASGDAILQNPAAFGFPEDYWEGTRAAAADLAFTQDLEIDLGGLTAIVQYPGQPTHSPGNSIVRVPSEGVVFTGDILFTNFHPYLGEGDLAGWDKALDMIAALDEKTIIPGHGPVSGAADIAALKAYLPFFDANARELQATMDDPAAIVAEMLKRLPQLEGGDFIVGMNIQTRYMPAAATGTQ